MKKLLLAVLMLSVLMGCAHLRESDQVDPVVHGAWVGEGRFYDRHLHDEYGTVKIELEVHDDNSVSGSVGAASLVDGTVKRRPNDFLIEATIRGQVFPSGSLPDEHKDRAVFILEPPDGEFARGDFHLKSNPTFDVKMRAGELTLSRSS